MLIAAKCLIEPVLELTKEKLQISAGRFLEEFDDACAKVLFRLIDRARKMHCGPQIAALATAENFFGVWQPIEMFASNSKLNCTA